MRQSFSYGKKEKLKSRKQLTQLFESRRSFFLYPLKVFYQIPSLPSGARVKAGVGVTSRNFKKATDRNRVKRLLREAYRLNKHPLHRFLEEQEKELVVFFLYIDKALPEGNLIGEKMPLVIRELTKRLV